MHYFIAKHDEINIQENIQDLGCTSSITLQQLQIKMKSG
jgi:hypothetical protein